MNFLRYIVSTACSKKLSWCATVSRPKKIGIIQAPVQERFLFRYIAKIIAEDRPT